MPCDAMMVPWRPSWLKLGKFETFSGGMEETRVLSDFEEKLPNYNIVKYCIIHVLGTKWLWYFSIVNDIVIIYSYGFEIQSLPTLAVLTLFEIGYSVIWNVQL